MTCFGEHLADIAADGGDVSAPVPHSWRSRARMAAKLSPARVMANEYSRDLAGEETTETDGKRIGVCAPESPGHSPATNLECGAVADGAQGDPATPERR